MSKKVGANPARVFGGISGEFFARDFMASVVVFLVALPLCLGVAVASGVPPALGLITGIVGGIVVAAFSGQPLQVSGPAAGLTVLIWELVSTHGLRILGVAVLLAGALQIAMALAGFGRWFRAISPAVIQGMLAGIGILIVSGQLLVMEDFAPAGTGLQNIAAIPVDLWRALIPNAGPEGNHGVALLMGVVALGVLVGWGRMPARFKAVPGPLVAIAVVVVIDLVFRVPVKNVSIDGNLLAAIQPPATGVFGDVGAQAIVGAGVAIALIASAETLLCASAVDKLHDGPKTKYNKELLAQGVGNSICGLLGALPMTGVIVRSKANIDAGAKTRLSAMLHGGWLLAFVALLPFVLEAIPVAALAAILVYTGFKLIDVGSVARLWKTDRAEAGIFFVTTVSVVTINLLEGVLIGFVLALVKLLWDFTHLDARVHDVHEEEDGDLAVSIDGAATFVRLPHLAETLESVPQGSKVRLKAQGLGHVDHASRELISDWKRQHEAKGGQVIVEQDAHGLGSSNGDSGQH